MIEGGDMGHEIEMRSDDSLSSRNPVILSSRQPSTWRRRFRRWTIQLVVCYLGVLVLLLSLENWFLFHPAPADHWDPPPSEIRAQDVEFVLDNGVTIHAWWCPTESWEPSRGALLYCHGNAGNLSFRGPNIARFQQSLGIAVLIFDYPGFGRSTGRPTEAGCYAAADAAYDWLIAKQNIAPNDVVLYGRSLGGAVATELATRKPPRALVLASSFTSIPDMAQT